MDTPAVETVEAYIAAFPAETQAALQALRAAILAAAPQAKEKISYHMPAYELDGRLVYFAGFKRHIGLYAAGSAIPAFAELAQYAGPKGSLRFPLNRPLPLDLIRQVVRFRVEENAARLASAARVARAAGG